jgi:tetratricopeptide (TPR) repeat protein
MTVTDPSARLDRLTSFLAQDPANRSLLADAAAAALAARRPQLVEGLLERYEALEPLSPGLVNLRALAALAEGRFDQAAATLRSLSDGAPTDPTLRFNLAWASAMTGDWGTVSEAIDEETVLAAPRAAALKVQALHHLGALEEALAWGAAWAQRLPEDRDLFSALSVVALDDEQAELAADYAHRAGPSHEGLSTLGMLALADQRVEESIAQFDAALTANPQSARALLGKGLTQLLTGQSAEAAEAIDRGAEAFGDHLGTWVTAGWAHFSNGNIDAARDRFEQALALDDNFAETHGALAVMDIVEGHVESAKRRTNVALGLDRHCLSAALARSLLLAGEGRADAAERVRQIALGQPVGPGGQTIAQAMIRLGMAYRPRQ